MLMIDRITRCKPDIPHSELGGVSGFIPAPCLPHIVTKNCLKALKTTQSQALKSG